jgi:formate C-acetyltransferase
MRLIIGEPNSIGRLDYILHDYYIRDLERGLVTREEAAEWLQVPRIKSAVMTGQSDSYILAGSNPDGSPFWNDLTYFILDAAKYLKLQGPQLWFRYAEGQPRELLKRAFRVIKAGIAQPGFFNDKIAVEAMERVGFAKEHAYDYVCCQCVELSPQGKSDILSAYSYNNIAKAVEVLMNGGKEIIKDNSWWAWPAKDFPGNIPLEFGTFNDFLGAYEKYLRYLLKSVVAKANGMLAAKPQATLTLASALIEGCIEQGLSSLEGGAVYNQTFPNFTGIVTAADSLAAIRQYVFEEKKASLGELAEICAANFEGRENENIRLYLLNRCPKYGNENPAADGLVNWILDIIDDELTNSKNIFGAVFGAEYLGWRVIDEQSYTLAATPDGRRHGEPPTGTLGGDQGRDRSGMTALLNSIASLDHKKSPGGINVNLRISPSLIEKDEGLEKMTDALIAYFDKGGMQAQINCISKEQLADAQKNPDKYRDLCVRVSGQSLYFTELGRALQNQIISRVEHV